METITITGQEVAEFEAFKQEKARREQDSKKQANREAYKTLVNETVVKVFPRIIEISESLAEKKKEIYDDFNSALDLKAEAFGIKEGQRSHTFTSTDGTKRITLGYHESDAYDDTVNEGIAKVQSFIQSLAKDQESQMLVSAIMRLLAKDAKGTLKASKVMLLRKMSTESGNAEFIDGVDIIEKAYRPVLSKQFVRADSKNERNEWVSIPLGMTEA